MIAFPANWFVLFPTALCLLVALRLAEGKADRRGQGLGTLAVRALIAMLFTFSVLAVGLRSSPLSIPWLLLMTVFAGIVWRKNRRLEQAAMLYTALGVKEPSNQAWLADSFYRENRGWVRSRAAALGRELARGQSWWTALERQGIAQGLYDKLAVRLTARYGEPQAVQPEAIGDAEVLAPLQIEAEAERLLGRLFFFSWALLLFPILGVFLAVVVPTLDQLSRESGLQLPPLLRASLAVRDSATTFGWSNNLLSLITLLLITLGILAAIGLGLALWLYPRLLQRRPLRWLCRDYYRNLGFTALARALEHEPDLLRACQATAELVPLPHLSVRYTAAAQRLSQGATPREALRKSGLLSRREFQVMALGFDNSNPAWSLKQLGTWKTARMLSRYSLLVQLAVVVLTLLLGAIVGGLAIGTVQTLCNLILAI
ncbi:MAG: type II secretion system F family protein [Planctomycetales bacterium]|nr:type II secretion system F family protein [Planctomycetales bacterium]